MARGCFVCGFESRTAVCPRCNTILRADQAVCRTCGKAFDGWVVATCDACGGFTVGEPEGPSDRQAVRTLSAGPRISAPRTQERVAKGGRDFADIVRLARAEHSVRGGAPYAGTATALRR